MPDEDRQLRDSLSQDREQLIGQMRGIRDHFVERVAEELPQRWDGVARDWVKSFADDAQRLGKEGLAQIKSEIAELADRAPEIANSHLTGPEVWSHEAELGNLKGTTYQPTGGGKNEWSCVSRPIGDAEDEVVSVLEGRFGGSIARRHGWDGAPLSPELVEIIREYAERHNRLVDLDKQIGELSIKIERDEAESLWDEA